MCAVFLAAFEGAVKTSGGRWGCVFFTGPPPFYGHFAEEWASEGIVKEV